MDLQWQVSRRRAWIELGERSNLTFGELAQRAGVSTRTLRRWSAALRTQRERDPLGQQKQGLHERVDLSMEGAEAEVAALDQSFVKVLEEPTSSQSNQIQIELGGKRRLVIDGAIDVEELARVISAVEGC